MNEAETVRFFAKVVAGPNGCHVWTAAKRRGYGAFEVGGRTLGAHRLAYVHYRGEIPAGLVLDHLCRNTACVNPNHLEPVTSGENVLRGEGHSAVNAAKTHCNNGHELVGDNLAPRKDGRRWCRTCRDQYVKMWSLQNAR